MQTDGEKDERDEVIPVAPHVAHHAARAGGDCANRRDGYENAHGEERRCPECAPRRHLALLTDEPDNEWDARQMAGAEDDAEDAPQIAALNATSGAPSTAWLEVREELFHGS